MPISGEAARRMLAEALANRTSIRSLAQILVALFEQLGKPATYRLTEQMEGPGLDEAYRLAEGLFDSESNWEIPVVSKKAPGALSRRVEKRHT